MKISTSKLMEIIEEFKEEYYDDYDVDLFDDDEWTEIEERINADDYLNDEKYVTEKTRRINIFVNAIRTKSGLEYVNAELKRVNLKEVYVRNFNELILYWCFKNNDENREYKIGPEEYDRIKAECNLFRETKKELMGSYDEHNTFADKITLRKIRQYIEDNSNVSDNMELLTRSITFNMRELIDKVDVSNFNERELCDTIIGLAQEKDNLINLTAKCEKTRYYFIKYLQYFIEYHIQEFIDLLNEFSSMTITEIKNMLWSEAADYLPWSVKSNVLEMLREAASGEEDIFSKEDIDVRIMQIISQVVCFEGKPLKEDMVNSMFKAKNGTLKYWSDTRDIGYIFYKKREEVIESGQYDTYMRHHEERKEEIENLTIESFMDYPIKISALARIIFERANGVSVEECETTSKNLKNRFKNALQGSVEISRDVLLYFMMVMDQILKDKPELLSENAKLTEARVNSVLNKCGFEVMSGKNIMDYIVKKSLKMSNTEFTDVIFDLFYDIREKAGQEAVVHMDNEALKTQEGAIDKQAVKKK